MNIIVGITGASGTIYGWRLLEKLRDQPAVETHLAISRAGERTAYLEMGKNAGDFKALATYSYSVEDIGARIASGSFLADAMVVAPCSVHTMAAIATGVASNLLIRAADVTLKERRRLVLMVRESPLHLGHLRNMATLAEMGAIIAPPMPAFYTHPKTLDDLVSYTVDRVLDLVGLASPNAQRWAGR